jgi:phospholipase C
VVIVQENHSFDNYFGTYPSANGTLVGPPVSQLQGVVGIPDGVCLGFDGTCVRPALSLAQSAVNPMEGQLQYEDDYSGGGTGFAQFSGPQSMVYFDYHTIPAYWDYAEEYGLGDNYFASVLGETTPNRLMMLTGSTPVSADYGPPPYVPYADTVMAQLDGAGVSWGYYDFFGGSWTPSNEYPLNYTSGVPASSAGNIQNVSRFLSDLSGGQGLPQVSFVNSLGSNSLSEHPPLNITKGEQWVVSVVNSVMESSYWNSTVIYLTWDEGGGFYDGVLPPREYTIDNGFGTPLIAISPFSRESYVSDTLMSHLSLLRFIEYNWGIPPLNSNVAQAQLPLDFFNFSQTPRAPLPLPGRPSYPLPLQVPPEGQSQGRTGGSFDATSNPQDGELAGTLAVATLLVVVAVRRPWGRGSGA